MTIQIKKLLFWPALVLALLCLWLSIENIYHIAISDWENFWERSGHLVFSAAFFAVLSYLIFRFSNFLAAEEYTTQPAGANPINQDQERARDELPPGSEINSYREIFAAPFSDDRGIADMLETHFADDHRIISFASNSGYQYTTGESSGNMDVAAADGQVELTTYHIKLKPEFYEEVKREHDQLVAGLGLKP